VSSARSLRILVVDDHEVVHWGLRTVLSTQRWVGRCLKASNREEALDLARRYDPHVALVDLFLGDDSGTEICAELVRQSPKVRVLLMSGAGRVSAAAARKAGASGFVSKDSTAAEIAASVAKVAAGKEVFKNAPTPLLAKLSRREREVLDLIASGATNGEIAQLLCLSSHTVKEHTSALYRKMDVRNRAEAVLHAQRIGLLS
jgi:DNA-binding NarL/FixJ family response regulator